MSRDRDREDFRADWSPHWSSDDEREWDDVDNERLNAEGGPDVEDEDADCEDRRDHSSDIAADALCEECEERPARHDHGHTLLCCACHKDYDPGPPLAPRERFGCD